MLLCRLGKKVLDRPAAVALAHLHLVALVPADEIEVLRQGHQARAGGRGGGDQAPGRIEVRRDFRRGNHLDGGDRGFRHGYWVSTGCACTASRSTWGSAQPPVTE